MWCIQIPRGVFEYFLIGTSFRDILSHHISYVSESLESILLNECNKESSNKIDNNEYDFDNNEKSTVSNLLMIS